MLGKFTTGAANHRRMRNWVRLCLVAICLIAVTWKLAANRIHAADSKGSSSASGAKTDVTKPSDPLKSAATASAGASTRIRGLQFSEATYRQLKNQSAAKTSKSGASAAPAEAGPVSAAAALTPTPPPASRLKTPPTLSTNFKGYDQTGAIPADCTVAVGPSSVIQVVNASLTITNRSGTSASTTSLNALFGSPVGSSGVKFEPWIQYDQFAGRFVLLVLTTNASKTDGWYLVAASKTSSPTIDPRNWHIYYIRNDLDFRNDVNLPNKNTAFTADDARLGLDDTYFYITSNQYSSTGVFQYAKLRRYLKSEFYSGQAATGYEWNNIKDPSVQNAPPLFSIRPALTFGKPGIEYLVACDSGGSSFVHVISLPTNSTTLTFNTVNTTAWLIPADARQKGDARLIDSGDARLLNAVYQNGKIYTCHTASIGTFPCASHYIVINTNNISKAFETTIGHTKYDYYYPSVSVSGFGTVATVFSFSGIGTGPTSARYAGVGYTLLSGSNGAISPLQTLKDGLGSYYQTLGGSANLWGSYNGIARDPSNGNILWVNGMYANSTQATPANIWATWLGSVVYPQVL